MVVPTESVVHATGAWKKGSVKVPVLQSGGKSSPSDRRMLAVDGLLTDTLSRSLLFCEKSLEHVPSWPHSESTTGTAGEIASVIPGLVALRV